MVRTHKHFCVSHGWTEATIYKVFGKSAFRCVKCKEERDAYKEYSKKRIEESKRLAAKRKALKEQGLMLCRHHGKTPMRKSANGDLQNQCQTCYDQMNKDAAKRKALRKEEKKKSQDDRAKFREKLRNKKCQ